MSVMRLYYSIRMQITHDVTYTSGGFGLWTLAEFATTIICGCMPTLPKFCQTIGPKLSLTLIWKGSKLRRAFAKQSVTASSSGPTLDMRGIKLQPQGKYTSLEELELGIPSGNGSTMSGASETFSSPLPSLSARMTSTQRQVEQ